MKGSDPRELPFDAAESETLSMRVKLPAREPGAPGDAHAGGGAGRSEKAQRRQSDPHVSGKSDDLVVPTKRANKAATPAAEPVEERGSTKGNGIQSATYRPQRRISRDDLSG